jgi:hypothetical protein
MTGKWGGDKMSEIKSEPAFPCVKDEVICISRTTGEIMGEVKYPGMDLRDYFAGQALYGFISSPLLNLELVKDWSAEKQTEHFAKIAYLQADAMLLERSK